MKPRTPKTNNAGETRDPSKAIKRFRSDLIQKIMTPKQYQAFLDKYKVVYRASKAYKPSEKEIKLYQQYSTGRLTRDAFSTELGIKTPVTFYNKIGKIHAYTINNPQA